MPKILFNYFISSLLVLTVSPSSLNKKDITQSYFESMQKIDQTNPIYIIDKDGKIPQQQFEFHPDKWSLQVSKSQTSKIKECLVTIYYSFEKDGYILKKSAQSKQTRITKGDWLMKVSKGPTQLFLYDIGQSPNAKKICNEKFFDKKIKGLKEISEFFSVFDSHNLFGKTRKDKFYLVLSFFEYSFEINDFQRLKASSKFKKSKTQGKVREAVDTWLASSNFEFKNTHTFESDPSLVFKRYVTWKTQLKGFCEKYSLFEGSKNVNIKTHLFLLL